MIGVLTSVIGAYYYIRIIKVMYFDPAAEAFDATPAALSVVAVGSALFTTFFFVFPRRSSPRRRRRRRSWRGDRGPPGRNHRRRRRQGADRGG